MDTKICRKCNLEKDATIKNFSKRTNGKFNNECKECFNLRVRRNKTIITIIIDEKECSKCNIIKEVKFFPKRTYGSDPKCTSKDIIKDFDNIKESDWYLIDYNNTVLNINNRNIITDEEMEKWKRLKNYEDIKDYTYFTTRQNQFNGRIFYNFTISTLVGNTLSNIQSNTRNIRINKILK